jgi:hypothetical protein
MEATWRPNQATRRHLKPAKKNPPQKKQKAKQKHY